MRNVPDGEYDAEEVARLNAEPWMMDLLRLNPDYNAWGPHEDYMATRDDGWDSRVLVEGWEGFGPWSLDDLNEVVNFYFEVERDSTECPTCGGDGYHPDAHDVVNTFYAHMNPRREHWNDAITADELQALKDAGRIPADAHLADVNYANARGGFGAYSHDAINRHILIETRLARQGLPKYCPDCAGHGTAYAEPGAHVNLILWFIHPRKGCSRGVEVKRLAQEDLPKAFAFLREAAARNAERFARIPAGTAHTP
jgi:hypothetical protein